ncbi:MAG TPA: hypothetical protein VFC07_15105 [Verrucomicrobiae bacterium]|nr:hypothetical protein [Verrucomicrobiae bacterium]
MKGGSPIKVGVQFFADVPLGRMFQIQGYVWPLAAGPIQIRRSALVPNADQARCIGIELVCGS